MTLSQLEYVVAAAKYQSFVKAADSCGVTQPTLSSMIQKLESELDVIIFNRASHPISETEAGAEIVKQAKIVIYNCNQLKERVNQIKDGDSGKIDFSEQ